MNNELPDFQFHVQLTLPSSKALRDLIRRSGIRLVHYQDVSEEKIVADFLVTRDEADAMKTGKYEMKIIARINTPDDLKREVSQTNRYQNALDKLKKQQKQ